MLHDGIDIDPANRELCERRDNDSARDYRIPLGDTLGDKVLPWKCGYCSCSESEARAKYDKDKNYSFSTRNYTCPECRLLLIRKRNGKAIH